MSTEYKAICPVKSWGKVPRLVDKRPAIRKFSAYGISRSCMNNEIWVDFGNDMGPISFAKITFRDRKDADDAYCCGLKLSIKVVRNPELRGTKNQ